MNRRKFTQAIAAGLGAAALPCARAAAPRNLKIGYTCITWGSFPRNDASSQTLEAAVKDISGLGFYSFETFPEILDYWDAKGALRGLIDRYQLPLKSGYFTTVLMDASKRKESVDRVIKLGKTVTKYGGTFAVVQPESVKRDGYNFKEYRANIIAGLNDHAMALTDLGLPTGLHQHTGTCIETHDEVYDVMNSANTKYLKFAPDVGQLQRGGSDPVQVCKDFLPLTEAYAPERFRQWRTFRLRSAGDGQGGHPGDPGHTGDRRPGTGRHGGTGLLPQTRYDASRDRPGKQGLSAEDGVQVPVGET